MYSGVNRGRINLQIGFVNQSRNVPWCKHALAMSHYKICNILLFPLALYIQVFRHKAENVMIAALDEANTFTKACLEVKSKLAGLSIKWLTQTCLDLERSPNPTATLIGMWSMMRLVCRCATDDCLKVVRQMTQELIGKLVL